MILYHGTNIDFKDIDLSKCLPYKDFGKGFYMTDIENQAMAMAIRKSRFVAGSKPYVQKYHFSESHLVDGSLSVKVFSAPSEEWAAFIVANRYNPEQNIVHTYDVVLGPVADDGVALQIGLYRDNLITLEALAKALEYKKLNTQYCFCTEKAITLLSRI